MARTPKPAASRHRRVRTITHLKPKRRKVTHLRTTRRTRKRL